MGPTAIPLGAAESARPSTGEARRRGGWPTIRTRLLSTAVLVLAVIGGMPWVASAAQTESIAFHHFALDESGAQMNGTYINRDVLQLTASGLESGLYKDPVTDTSVPFESGTWTSPPHDTNFGFTELVASWSSITPPGTWLKIEMKATTDQKLETDWYTLGIWASDSSTIHRTSVGGQADGNGSVAVDTFFAKDHSMIAYTLRVTLFRRAGTSGSPSFRAIGAVASNAPDVNSNPYVPSSPGAARGVTLNVPPLSQEVHTGEYPEFDGGGEAWCSPTSTAMVVRYWGTGPNQAQLRSMPASTDPSAPTPTLDPDVDYAAMHTFDANYAGTGNWPFNTAYAASFGLDAEVTQLHSLAEAETFIRARIPLVASVAFSSNQLPAFLFKSTSGHLLVIVGFTSTGDVVVNDPAAVSDQTVRKTYDRQSFERAWLNSTGGIVYVIHPSSVPLPNPNSQPNW
jgi:peptidase C39-like protein